MKTKKNEAQQSKQEYSGMRAIKRTDGVQRDGRKDRVLFSSPNTFKKGETFGAAKQQIVHEKTDTDCGHNLASKKEGHRKNNKKQHMNQSDQTKATT